MIKRLKIYRDEIVAVFAVVVVFAFGGLVGNALTVLWGDPGEESMTHSNCRCPCTCGHAHDEQLPPGCEFCLRDEKEKVMTLYEMAKSIRETNDANGFNSPTWDNLLTKLMLTVTELDEGVMAVQGVGEDPLTEELADTAIRILDVLYSIWGTGWSDRTTGITRAESSGIIFEPIEVVLWRVLRHICRASEYWRHNNKVDARIALEIALHAVFAEAAAMGCDLNVIIEWKNAKNATRGKLHGKERPDG